MTGRWQLMAGLFLVLTLSSGFGFYNLSLYMAALVAERGLDTAAASVAVSLVFLAGGLAGLGVARLLDVLDVRVLMTGGALLGGLALLVAPLADGVSGLYLAFALFGVGNAGCSLVPATTLVARSFAAHERAAGLSVTSTGLSVGGIVITPASAWLIEGSGLAVAMPWFGALYALVITAVAWLVLPTRAARPAGGAAAEGQPVPGAARSRHFVALTGAWVLVMLAQVGGIAHLYPAVAAGAGTAPAALAVSLLAAASITGRLAGGWLLGRVPAVPFARVCMVLQGVAMLGLALGDGAPVLLGSAALFGLTVGNLLMLPALLIADAWGTAGYARLFALNQLLTMLGVALGPLALGLAHDLAGGLAYAAAFGLAALASLLALFVHALAGPAPEQPVA